MHFTKTSCSDGEGIEDNDSEKKEDKNVNKAVMTQIERKERILKICKSSDRHWC